MLLCDCGAQSKEAKEKAEFLKMAETAMSASGMDAGQAESFMTAIRKNPDRFISLVKTVMETMAGDPSLLLRADKRKGLAESFEPADLVPLDNSGLVVSRSGLRLRKPALDALKEMDGEARSRGIALPVSSAYRSFAYQKEVFARNVKEMGEFEASRVSARPGASQHQLGTAIDFGSITDAFAETKAGVWLGANAGRFGFSLSYPKGMESETGYVWESWHYRYIGKEAAALQEEFFGGVQHWLMLFLDALPPARSS